MSDLEDIVERAKNLSAAYEGGNSADYIVEAARQEAEENVVSYIKDRVYPGFEKSHISNVYGERVKRTFDQIYERALKDGSKEKALKHSFDETTGYFKYKLS